MFSLKYPSQTWFKCNVCESIFTTSARTWSHLWRVHKVQPERDAQNDDDWITEIKKGIAPLWAVKVNVTRCDQRAMGQTLVSKTTTDSTDVEESDSDARLKSKKVKGPKPGPKSKKKKKNNKNEPVLEGFFECSVCEQMFESKPEMLNHRWNEKHDPDFETQSSYKCLETMEDGEICGEVCRTPKTLEVHKCSHDSRWANMNSTEKHNFKIERLEAVGCPLTQCPMCPMKLVFPWRLAYHLRGHTAPRVFECETCGVAYKSKDVLERHVAGNKCGLILFQKATRSVVCEICNTSLSSKKGLRAHKRQIHGIKQIREKREIPQCHLCDYKASGPEAYQRHMNFHKGIKPFSCANCDSRFTSNCNLRAHIKFHCPASKANGEAEKMIADIEFKKSASDAVKRNHMFNCSLCPEVQESQGMLNIHMKKHEGRKFTCPECLTSGFPNSEWATLGILLFHRKRFHNTKKDDLGIPCQYCDKMLVHEASVRKHYLGVHGRPPPSAIFDLAKINPELANETEVVDMVQEDSDAEETFTSFGNESQDMDVEPVQIKYEVML